MSFPRSRLIVLASSTGTRTCCRVNNLRRSGVSLTGRKDVTRRRLSTSSSSEVEAVETSGIQAEEATLVTRHGKGDGVIMLNVGGKEFITLRSTIQNNPILHQRVLAAEANQEFTQGAVFIDRDPTYFHLILQHLRNRADMMHNPSNFKSSNSILSRALPQSLVAAKKTIFKKKDVLIQLPEKKEALRDLYVEARYFQIVELEALLCSMDWYTMIAQWFGSGSTNPFYTVSQAITAIRNALVASSGLGIVLGAQNEELVKTIKGRLNDIWAIVPSLPRSKPSALVKSKNDSSPKNYDDEPALSFD